MNDQDIKARARRLIDSAVNAVFITLDNEGYPHPRTMWTAGIDDDFTVYFLTGLNLVKVKQIETNPNVCVFWTRVDNDVIGWDYALIKGRATVTNDQDLRNRFWNDSLKEYFPGGRTDPDYVVIVVTAREMMIMDSHKYPLDHITF